MVIRSANDMATLSLSPANKIPRGCLTFNDRVLAHEKGEKRRTIGLHFGATGSARAGELVAGGADPVVGTRWILDEISSEGV